MLRELIAVTRKNLIRLFRSKLSTAAILMGPLLLIVLVGLAFGTTKLQGISVGAYVEEHNDNIDKVLSGLKDSKDTFAVKEYSSNKSCVDSVMEGESHICVSFIKNTEDKNVNVYFYVDYSRLSLVWVLLNAMNSRISTEAANIGTDVSKSLLTRVQSINTYVAENGATLQNLSNGSADMQKQLTAMSQTLSSLDLANPVNVNQLGNITTQANDQANAIKQQQAQIDKQVSDSRTQLVQTRKQLVESRDQVRQTQSDLSQWISQLKAAESTLQCGGATVIDLTPYLQDNETLQRELAKLERPDCSVIYSARLDMEKAQSQSKQVEQQLNTGIAQIDDALLKLDQFQQQSSAGSAQAIASIGNVAGQLTQLQTQAQAGNVKLAELQVLRKTMIAQLANASAALNQSGQMIGAVQQGIDSVKTTLNDVSSITPEAIIKPFSTNLGSVTKSKREFDFLFPSLVALVIMFVSVLTASTIVMKEKTSRAYFRNFITPSSFFTFFTGVFITSIIISCIQVLVITGIATVFFHINAFNSPLSLLFITVLGVGIFSMLGMTFGYLFTSEEATTLISIISCVILFIFSSVMIPLESMDPFFASIARVNPFVAIDGLLRRALLFNVGFNFTSSSFIVVLVELCVFGVLAVFAIRYARTKF